MNMVIIKLETEESWKGLISTDSGLQVLSSTQGFVAKKGQWLWVATQTGEPRCVYVGYDINESFWQFAGLPDLLPPKVNYRLDDLIDINLKSDVYLAWQLGQYEFDRFLSKPKQKPSISIEGVSAETKATASTILQIRDWINTPAEDLGPGDMVELSQQCAKMYQAECKVWLGAKLRKEFPLVATVGRASTRPPAMIQLQKKVDNAPHIILVGKGVCFDSGGLDIKPSSGMRWMKKDMGGAAHVLGLAHLIWQMDLPISLTVLIPTADNSISGDAFRPGDVYISRNKVSVEVGNTDAEGRLLLADALAYGSELKPDWMIDFATLTGAARVAMGLEIPCYFSNDEQMEAGLKEVSKECEDCLWPLPLWEPYQSLLNSSVADISSTGSSPYGGAITAALFLQRFVGKDIKWSHIDLNAFNMTNKAGRPEGGEAMGLRAVYAWIQSKVAKKID
ncbi:MAG TPA: leucyl aminopeptidase family protein [Gammaproteobacteria bacterium]|nr:leucyl aminopeptidase family protein [Gammaproteobacteria bacterium]